MNHDHATILIIEDDDAVRQTLVDTVEINGYSAMSARNGEEGMSLMTEAPPQLVITDLAMPGMSGFDVIEKMRADETLRTIPVIVVTAKVEREAMRHGMDLGADDFITKPFTEDEVLHSITARLEKKDLLDELDAFAHTVAHDLRSPLATVIGRAELALMMVEKLSPEQLRRHLEELKASSSRLNTIVDEILTLAGVRRQEIDPEPLDMTAIVSEALERVDAVLQEHGAAVELPGAWPEAMGYAPWVTHVWSNFLSNAAKYGGENPRIVIKAEVGDRGNSVRFAVQDFGPGIEADIRNKLFTPFTMISTQRVKGHGLGLSIVARIITKLHGRYGVISQPGEGSEFWFSLPIATDDK